MKMQDHIKSAGDVISVSVSAAVLVKWLPAIAALFSIAYTGMRMYEWIERRWRAKWPKPRKPKS